MLNLDNFICDAVLFTQPHPLAENSSLSLASFQGVTSSEEVWEVQKRDRISGLHKRISPLDYATSWEYWWSIPGRMLLPEDMEVLEPAHIHLEFFSLQAI